MSQKLKIEVICMKAFNKLINNASGLQTKNIYSLYNRLHCLC